LIVAGIFGVAMFSFKKIEKEKSDETS